MTLAVRWGDGVDDPRGGFLYFDTVLNFNEAYRGQATKHPVDGGSSITDHFIKENPVYTISAVISAEDISIGTVANMAPDEVSPTNTQLMLPAVVVKSSDNSLLSKFIPNVIGQFIPDKIPEVVVTRRDGEETQTTERGKDVTDPLLAIREQLIQLNNGIEVYNEQEKRFDYKKQTCKLYEFEDFSLKREIGGGGDTKLIVTSLTFREDSDTGYALYFDIVFEAVTYVPIKRAEIPASIRKSLNKKAASKSEKGKQDSTVKSADGSDGSPKADADPLRKVAAE